jgi:hypothetical protein
LRLASPSHGAVIRDKGRSPSQSWLNRKWSLYKATVNCLSRALHSVCSTQWLQPGTKTTQERRALANLFVTVDRNAQQKLKKRALPEEFPADYQQAHEICTKPKADSEGGLGMSFPTSAGQAVQAHRSPVCPRRSARRGLRQPPALAAAPGRPRRRLDFSSSDAAATQQRRSSNAVNTQQRRSSDAAAMQHPYGS